MEKFILTSYIRNEIGSSKSNSLRKKGIIPAVLYGGKKENINLSMSLVDMKRLIKFSPHILTLKIFDNDNKLLSEEQTLLKEIQYDPVSENIFHIDLYRISVDKPIEVKIPVKLTGTPVGVTKDNGVLEIYMHEIEIKCLPANMPEKFDVDISNLEIGKVLYCKDINLPKNVELLSAPEAVVVSVHRRKEEVVVTPEAIAPTPTEPEVITKKPTEEEKLSEMEK